MSNAKLIFSIYALRINQIPKNDSNRWIVQLRHCLQIWRLFHALTPWTKHTFIWHFQSMAEAKKRNEMRTSELESDDLNVEVSSISSLRQSRGRYMRATKNDSENEFFFLNWNVEKMEVERQYGTQLDTIWNRDTLVTYGMNLYSHTVCCAYR